MRKGLRVLAIVFVGVSSSFAQTPPTQGAPPPPATGAPAAPARGRQGPPPLGPHGTRDPFPAPIPAIAGAIKVNFVEFAVLPDVGPNAARPMLMSYEPGTRRMFVNDMHGALYSVSNDGKTVTPYLDHQDPRWNIQVQFQNFERGFQSFAFHPDFNRRGAPGYGKIYTYTDTSNVTPTPDWTPFPGAKVSHHAVLLEWTAKNPAAATYDGDAPRELMRWHRPFVNHNGGQLAFNPTARRGSADYGMLYAGNADGGSGGDPQHLAQNLASSFGKILRIDPLGADGKGPRDRSIISANGKYGIPKDNPFVNDNDPNTLGEIWAYGARNPQRFAWDSKTGVMYMADIGQGISEEVTTVTRGANLGWRVWEGSFRFVNGAEVSMESPRSDPKVTYPVVEFAQLDPLLQNSSAVTMGYVYRHSRLKALRNLLLFGDNPSGEMFYVNADNLPKNGGQDAIRRIVFNDNGQTKTLLELVKAKAEALGKKPPTRADLRYGEGPDGRIFILNKWDGVIREIVP
ncbi:MAG TPA: PQQ-dependent sugar dehydrogenase [Vicinamibacterales bacterium]|nr:PQQ-dependent sugar dehydrogenase [Vicinamibacterales bacterium]